jgi:hypothetical protein
MSQVLRRQWKNDSFGFLDFISISGSNFSQLRLLSHTFGMSFIKKLDTKK